MKHSLASRWSGLAKTVGWNEEDDGSIPHFRLFVLACLYIISSNSPDLDDVVITMLGYYYDHDTIDDHRNSRFYQILREGRTALTSMYLALSYCDSIHNIMEVGNESKIKEKIGEQINGRPSS